MYDDFFLDAASDDLVRREGVLLDNTSSVRSDSSRLDMLAAAVTMSNKDNGRRFVRMHFVLLLL